MLMVLHQPPVVHTLDLYKTSSIVDSPPPCSTEQVLFEIYTVRFVVAYGDLRVNFRSALYRTSRPIFA